MDSAFALAPVATDTGSDVRAQDVDFRILGPVEVDVGGNPVDIGGPRQRAVLAVLVCQAARTVPAERVIDLVWGEQAPAGAQSTLQAYVSTLRRAIEPDRGPGARPTLIVTRGGGYALDVATEQVDARRFESLAASGRNLLADRPHRARDVLRDALALWRGDALADLGDLPFVQAESSRLGELRALALENLVEARLHLGEHEAVVGDVEQLVRSHPYREHLWALLMLALYRSGRQAEALGAYRHARELLSEELGIDPGPELQRLESDILNQSAVLDWRPPPEAISASSLDRPLVGRGPELALVERTLRETVARRGRVLLVFGEAGIGKTRLAETLEDRARRAGADVAWGNCIEGDAAPPYWPWAEAFRDLDARGAGSPLLELLPDAEAGAETRSRVYIYDAIARALAERAYHRPLVIILDDAHWADAASLELLRRVAGAARHAPLCVAATYRDADVRMDHPLTDTLGALTREAVLDRIPLQGLAPSAVTEFVEHATGSRPTDEVAAALHRRTDGNPFFVAELVRLFEHDAGTEILATAVPLGVRDAISRRVGAMRGPARDLIGAAAVLGRAFDLSTLASVAATDVESVVAELEPSVTGGLVAIGTGAGRWRFRHDLVRETLYDSMSPVRRVRLHARVAEALIQAEPNDDDEVVAELAHHCWHGAAVLRPERAVTHVLRAAQQAEDRLAYERAERLYAQAGELLDAMPTENDTLSLKLRAAGRLVDLRRIRFGHGAPAVGAALVRARDLAIETGAHDELLHALWSLRSYHTARAEFDVAEHVALRLIELADRSHDALVGAAGHQSVGAVAMHRGDAATASHHFDLADRCVAVRKQNTGLAAEIAVYTPYLHAMAMSGAGRFDEALRLAAVGMARARAVGQPYLLTYAHATEAWLGTARDDVDHVNVHGAAQRTLAAEHGFQLHIGPGVTGGWARAQQGSAEEGEASIEAGIRDWEAADCRMLLPYFLGLLAEAQLLAGRPRDAITTLERARQIGEATGERIQDLLLERVAGRIAGVRA